MKKLNVYDDDIYVSYSDIFPNMTERQYLDGSAGEGPYKKDIDNFFDAFLSLTDEDIEAIIKSINPDIEVLDVLLDIDGVEVALPYIDVTYKAYDELDMTKLEAEVVKLIKSVIKEL